MTYITSSGGATDPATYRKIIAPNQPSQPPPVFSSLSDIFESAAIIHPTSPGVTTYGLGIVCQTTPAALGVLSPNRDFSSPVIGSKLISQRIFSHHGNLHGATCSLYMIPESTSAVIVLSYARGLSDTTDWIAQGYNSNIVQCTARNRCAHRGTKV